MKQHLLTQIKQEACFLNLAAHISQKLTNLNGKHSLNPVEILKYYFYYLDKTKFDYTIKKTKNNELKVKIKKELLGSKDPFTVSRNLGKNRYTLYLGVHKEEKRGKNK